MEKSKLDIGEKNRRQVMGDDHVDRALEGISDFEKPMQDMIMEMAWGTTWDNDEHLSKKTRSMLTLAMLTVLRAHGEIPGHVRGALRNGCSKEEIREIMMHAVPYAGCPAGLSAFKSAKPILDEWVD